MIQNEKEPFGQFTIGLSGEVALGLMEQSEEVTAVCVYPDDRKAGVILRNGREIRFQSTLDDDILAALVHRRIAAIAHLSADFKPERKYCVGIVCQ